MTKTQNIIYYVLLVLISVAFIPAGYLKLVGNAQEVQAFTMVNLPIWFMYFIGVAELAGVIGLWIPKLQKWAVCGLEIIMVGAIVVSIMEMGIKGAIIPLVVFIILAIVSKMGKKRCMSARMATPASAPQM